MLMLIDFLPPCRAAGRCYLDGTLRDVLQIVLFFQWTETTWKRHVFFVGFCWWWGAASWPETFHLMGCCFPIRTRRELRLNYMETNVEGMILFGHGLVLVHYKMAHVQETQLQFWVANLVVTTWCCHVVCQTIHAFYANISQPARSPSLCKNFAMS